jgi:N-acetylmuramoyl-L-alanine amidase
MKKINSHIKKILILSLFLIFGFSAFAQSQSDIKLYNLTEYIENQGATLSWDSLSSSGILEKNGHTVSFRVDDELVIADYRNFYITDAPIQKNGNVFITENFAEVCSKVFSLTSSTGYFKIGAVLIDAGHGGKDPGAVETHTINGKKVSLQEKDITLSVAKKLYAKLQSQYSDKKILMTRTEDKFLSLEERVEIANNV